MSFKLYKINSYSKRVMRPKSGESPKEWDFCVSFQNSMIKYFYELTREFTRDEILEYTADTYLSYISHHLYLKDRNTNKKAVTRMDIDRYSKKITRDQQLAVARNYVRFNKESQMIGE